MPEISIITVCLNDKIGLERTIQSVLAQNFTDIEFFIIDGGSSDGSLDVLKKYSNRITNWVSEKDNGIYDAMNKGISKSRGRYCLFLNAGDYLAEENVLEEFYKWGRKEDIVYGDMILKTKDNKETLMKSPDSVSIRRMLVDTIWHPVSFIKRTLFENYGPYNLQFKIVADYEFFVRTIIKEEVTTFHIPKVIAVFDDSGISSNMNNRDALIKERNQVQDLYFNRFLLYCFRLYSKWRN
jgi:glycosyltransferase involved in cell wall biosynthesis